ncbi:hypothetical protein KZ869_34495, partial [Pseudomonas aeruginosa]
MTPEGRMHGLFLGIDCGTQGSKALLLDAGSGRTLGLGSAAQRPPEAVSYTHLRAHETLRHLVCR